MDPPQSSSKLEIMGIWTQKGVPKGGPKGVPKWSKMGSGTQNGSFLDPPLKHPFSTLLGDFRVFWPKMGQKGVKKGSKSGQKGSFWTHFGSILGPRGIFGVIEHFSCTPVLGGGLRPPGDPKMSQKWIKTGKKGHFGPILGPVSGPP